MDKYNISNDFLEIVAGTTNRISPVYKEAASAVDSVNDKGINYLRNFLISIDKVASSSKVKDERISASKGNIKSFAGYNDIVSVMEFLKKNLSGVETVADCIKVFDKLEEFAPLYADGYSNGVDIIKLEYESALYMLITSLSMLMANNIEMVSNGTQIKIQKKKKETFGVIPKTMHDLAIQLMNKDHKEYLESLMKVVNSKEYKESVTYMEGATIHDTIQTIKDILTGGYGVVSKSFKMIKSIKASMFGIIPLIRSIVYLKYKKKADTIVRLEEQAAFIKLNIEQLNNRTNIDEKEKEKIIKKQEAACEKYLKKAEKLRAELCETEKDTVTELKKDEPNLKKESSVDDEFILEAFNGSKKSTRKHYTKEEFKKEWEANNKKMHEQFWLFERKKKKKDKEPVKEITKSERELEEERVEKIVWKAVDAGLTSNPIKCIRIEDMKYSEDDPVANRTKTKFGGVPYWPKDKKYPLNDNGEEMIMIAQLNFDELPKLDKYPSKGILQFFINDEKCDPLRIVYHETISDDFADVNLDCTTLNMEKRNKDFPVTGVTYPTSTKIEDDNPPVNSDLYRKEVNKVLKDELGENFEKTTLTEVEVDNILSWIEDKLDDLSYLPKIGGYPAINWSNFVLGKAIFDPDYSDKMLLLQLDSSKGMWWGKGYLARFFISEKDLTALNFDGKVIIDQDKE